jgi:dCTP deaminase
MSIRSDRWIEEMCKKYNMIEPFEKGQVSKGVISYGVSAYGYDMRVGNEFKIFKQDSCKLIDPKSVKESDFETFSGDVCVIPPNSYILARSVEYFRIPRNVVTLTSGKSTYARCGIIVNVTPFEPEWEGYVTISISNTTPVPAKIYANEGLCQVLFFESDDECRTSYADKKGKYQAQQKITSAKIK